MSSSKRSSRFVFTAICAASALAVAGYIYKAKQRHAVEVAGSAPAAIHPVDKAPAQAFAVQPAKAAAAVEPAAPRLFFRYNAPDQNYGKLAFVRQNGNSAAAFAGELTCEAVYVAAGRGICLTADRGILTTYEAVLFDANGFRRQKSIRLGGIPSRCRVSPDGKLAAFTVFVSGHSYASVDFTTQTLLVDAETGTVLADLEEYAVTRNGERFANQDFNFWGVTFTPDAKQFYCTLSTNRQHFLVKGDVASKTAAVVHEQVECPSLSPDGTRIAYKKRFLDGARLKWRTQVLKLDGGQETPLQEERSVDDQLEWLDNRHVLYALPASDTGSSASTNVWIAAADGSQSPRLFLKNAYSPSVER